MKKLSEIYKDLGIAFKFPIDINDENGNQTYLENREGFWYRREYDDNRKRTYYENSGDFWYRKEYDESGHETYYENSDDYWDRREYDDNGNLTYYENSEGLKQGTKKSSCAGKVVEIDGKKYKLTEL